MIKPVKPRGYLSIVLHAHLPYVRHPEYDDFLEEDWLYEAISETYIPLLQVFYALHRDKVDYHLTISFSPTLISMLQDELLMNRYVRKLEKLIELTEKEIKRTKNDPVFSRLARMYNEYFLKIYDTFVNRFHCNLIYAFKKLSDMGHLELITSSATHCFLPLARVNEKAVYAQVKTGVETFRKSFGDYPPGMWLPECGYYPGLEKILESCGVKYFFTDTHGVLLGRPRPKYGVFNAYFTKSDVAFFGRDMETSRSVWSSKDGYPGDYYYREFYRDVGYDLDFDYIKEYINPDGMRKNTGVKYYRITGLTNHKEPYDPVIARKKAAAHAENFLHNRQQQVESLGDLLGIAPIITAPYDAELFGHWWFEGPMFLEMLLRKMHFDQNRVKTVLPSAYLNMSNRHQVVTPSFSSWGYKGYGEVWLDPCNDWIYPHLHKAQDLMSGYASSMRNAAPGKARILNQMTRELMLAQSSDWPFLIKMGTAVHYAEKRVKEHINNFIRLNDELKKQFPDERFLGSLEEKDNIFPGISYKIYS